MTKLILLVIAIALSTGVMAQKIERILTSEQTLFLQTPKHIRMERMDKAFDRGSKIATSLATLPEVKYAGTPFDLYFVADGNCNDDVTIELYDLRGKRPKRMTTQKFTPDEEKSFSVMLWVTFEEPGEYEIAAYQEAGVAEAPYPEHHIFRRTINVLPKKQ